MVCCMHIWAVVQYLENLPDATWPTIALHMMKHNDCITHVYSEYKSFSSSRSAPSIIQIYAAWTKRSIKRDLEVYISSIPAFFGSFSRKCCLVPPSQFSASTLVTIMESSYYHSLCRGEKFTLVTDLPMPLVVLFQCCSL